MPKLSFVDFKAVKAAITMIRVLEHYGLVSRFKRSGETLSGPCPIHKGNNPTQFRVCLRRNIWNCFSECKHGGNTLDFISRMENVTIHAAALKAIEWFQIDAEAMSNASETQDRPEDRRPAENSTNPIKSSSHGETKAAEPVAANKPLKFRLDKLDRNHPSLTERGLTPETILDFGVGFCGKGVMADRIAIPIHNPDGAIVAYAGRLPGEPGSDLPKYKLPQGFRKSLELFNLDRARKEPDSQPLIIVEGFFDCMKLHQHGCRKVVALHAVNTARILQRQQILTSMAATPLATANKSPK
jgi:DNA primase